MKLTEHRRIAQGLADLLLYAAVIDDGVLLLQDGALMAAWSFRGPDMASATHQEMAALSARLNSILRLGSGWMVHCDAIRSCAPMGSALPMRFKMATAATQRSTPSRIPRHDEITKMWLADNMADSKTSSRSAPSSRFGRLAD